ncbi:alpha/beta hydrolase [Streptomyces sp. NPDC057939]|uniref:alpha/beta hydrolase n=1 Tax=Streptomyces sp. NPDC057939 TaxID=3346284 RepID=UPI0036EED807
MTTGNRIRRTLLAGLVAAAVVFPVSAAASPQAPAPLPAVLAESATAQERYTANLDNLTQAARRAQDAGHLTRSAKLRAMAGTPAPVPHGAPAQAGPARFLDFDGRGRGRAVEVLGDLDTADRIAVLVPGSDTTLDTWARFREGAVALQQRLQADHPRSAVVAWLGYDTPGTVSTTVLTAARADLAAAELGPFLSRLRHLTVDGARISLLCHSYGSVVCARTTTGSEVTDIALYGSPGTRAETAAELPTRARVWAGRGTEDWIGGVPHIRIGSVGFGTDPVERAFGARPFAAGSAGHSDYLKPGSTSLASLAHIVLGPPAAPNPVTPVAAGSPAVSPLSAPAAVLVPGEVSHA